MSSDLYFYNQSEFRKIQRRYRKLPEDLPESLRFAHLNPKVAALLANKERAHKDKEDPFGDGLGQKSLLPDINTAFQNVRNQFDSALSNDEDSQRYLFEEAKYSAQGILEQLSKIIYFYEELYKHIPKSLEYQLMSGYSELTADVTVVPREWQTQEMKEQYAASLQREAASDLEEYDEELSRPRSRMGTDKSVSEVGSRMNLKKNRPRLGVIEASPDEDTFPSESRAGGRKTVSRQSVMSQNKSHLDMHLSRMGSRVRKGSIMSGASPSVYKGRMKDDLFSMIDETPSDLRSTAMAGPLSYMQTINFQLSNKSFEDKGWIMLKGRHEEVDPNAIIEHCVSKLQETMKQSAAYRQKEIELGYDKAAVVRYYGDTRKETILKFRKSPLKSTPSNVHKGGKPHIPSITDERNEGKKLMQATHIDGTTIIYYPSGRPAIIYSAAGFGRPGYYTIVYEDGLDSRVLACFTPAGKGVCYHPNGVVKFLSTEKGGHLSEDNGALEKKWRWPQAVFKITEPINFQISPHVMFRCLGRTQMSIVFSCQKETARFSVSPSPGVEDFKPGEDTEQLLTAFTFSSKTAKDLMRIFAPMKKPKKSKGRKTLIVGMMMKLFKDVTAKDKEEEKTEEKEEEVKEPEMDEEVKHIIKQQYTDKHSLKKELAAVEDHQRKGKKNKTAGKKDEKKDADQLIAKIMMQHASKKSLKKEMAVVEKEVKLEEEAQKRREQEQKEQEASEQRQREQEALLNEQDKEQEALSKQSMEQETVTEQEEELKGWGTSKPEIDADERDLISGYIEKLHEASKKAEHVNETEKLSSDNEAETVDEDKQISDTEKQHSSDEGEHTSDAKEQTSDDEEPEVPEQILMLRRRRYAVQYMPAMESQESLENTGENKTEVTDMDSEDHIEIKVEDSQGSVKTDITDRDSEDHIEIKVEDSQGSVTLEDSVQTPRTSLSTKEIRSKLSDSELRTCASAKEFRSKPSTTEMRSSSVSKERKSKLSVKDVRTSISARDTGSKLALKDVKSSFSARASGSSLSVEVKEAKSTISTEENTNMLFVKEAKTSAVVKEAKSSHSVEKASNLTVAETKRNVSIKDSASSLGKLPDKSEVIDQTKTSLKTDDSKQQKKGPTKVTYKDDKDAIGIVEKEVKAKDKTEDSITRRKCSACGRQTEESHASKSQTSEIVKLLQDFPDKVTYELEADKELARLQRKARNLVDDWMEHYRIAVGLTSPALLSVSETPHYSIATRHAKSAKQSEDSLMIRKAVLGIDDDDNWKKARVPSAPLAGRMIKAAWSSSPFIPSQYIKQRTPTPAPPSPVPRLLLSGLSGEKYDDDDDLLDVPFDTKRDSTVTFEEPGQAGGDSSIGPTAAALINRLADTASRRSARSKASSARSMSPSRQSVFTSMSERIPSALSGGRSHCPLVIRQQILGYDRPQCRCSRHHIPFVMDLEIDEYINTEVPEGQLIVIMVVSSLFPGITKAEEMLNEIYQNQNRNRTRPCVQSRSDMFRVFKYDINTAAEMSDHTQPLLLTRHSVVPGMFLMYCDGKLLFCDHIFNGYGSARKDFKKQVMTSRHDAIQGNYLPKDFKFSPSRGRSGMRSAWGGEIGGAGVDTYSSPGTVLDSSLVPIHRPVSSSTGNSKEIQLDAVRLEEAAKLIATSLSSTGFQQMSLLQLVPQPPVQGTKV